MSDTIDLSALGGKIPPHKVFRVSMKDAIAARTKDSTVMAHMMSVAEGSGVLVFHTWRLETWGETQLVVPYCTDAFATWDEAHEVSVAAVPAGKKAH